MTAQLPPPVRQGLSPSEQLLCEMFAAVLMVERVGPDDDFFQLGGHSMLAVRLQRRLRPLVSGRLGVQDVLRYRTPRALAARLGQQGEEDRTDPLLALRATGDGVPLFCVHPILGLSWSYAALLPHLSAHEPLYGLQSTGDNATSHRTLDDLAEEYVERVRRVQPDGPYRLVGWSLGGLIAQAMATSLQRRNEWVALLALIDAYPVSVFTGDRDAGVLDSLLDSVSLVNRRGSVLGRAGVAAALHEATGLADADRLVDAALANDRLVRDRTPHEFHGDLLFFSALKGRPHGLHAGLWQPTVTGTIREHQVHAAHHDMLRSPAVGEVGRVIARELADGTDHSPPGW
ncbi:hypothetical protein E1265_21765 [Streptomyces sp. 8K308]|uniref:thioesterase domain-containing protein n=1 Tax=Streptomyces sp. 8K308 TaxID=2530388 RepID=UPI00104E2A06|nr:thioesterase domain-containing protein [Streptomyces sp. 8K308]TDC20538.1 hypothetical protein E1265_21765 [Streptomyces sp. 8K308]